MSKNLDFIDFLNQREPEDDDESVLNDEEEEETTKDSVNIPINGSPLYPRIYIGDSAMPLSTGPFPETEVGDDNINSSWKGFLMGFYG